MKPTTANPASNSPSISYISLNHFMLFNIPLMFIYVIRLLLHRTVFPLVKDKKDSIKLTLRDWRSETSLTVFPLSGFSVKAGGHSSIFYTVYRATFLRFLTLSVNDGQYFSLPKRILELLRSSVSALAYVAERTVMGIRFVKQKPLHEVAHSGSNNGFCLRFTTSNHEIFTPIILPCVII